MTVRSLVFALTLGTAPLVGLSGCATLHPVTTRTEVPGLVRVELKERDRELFKLMVFNESDRPITVDRDAVTMRFGGQDHARVPGGVSSVYQIMPRGYHAVNVKFRTGAVHAGEAVYIDFHNAVFVDGQPLHVDSIELAAN